MPKGVYKHYCGKKSPHYGKRHSEKTKQYLRELALAQHENNPNLRVEQSERMKEYWKDPEYRKHLSDAHKGKHLSEEAKDKVSKNHARYWLGKKLPEETLRQMSLARRGEKNANWIDGRSYKRYPPAFNNSLKNLIRERYNYVCQVCGQFGKCVHHVDYDRKNCDPSNLRTLCKVCNSKVNFNRDFWQKFFGFGFKFVRWL